MNHILFLFFAVGEPVPKQLKYAKLQGARPACCKAPSEEVKQKSSLNFCEEVPVYYHWFAVALQDKLLKKDLSSIFDKYMVDHLPERVDTLVKQLLIYREEQTHCNEYKCASLFHNALSRFFF